MQEVEFGDAPELATYVASCSVRSADAVRCGILASGTLVRLTAAGGTILAWAYLDEGRASPGRHLGLGDGGIVAGNTSAVAAQVRLNATARNQLSRAAGLAGRELVAGTVAPVGNPLLVPVVLSTVSDPPPVGMTDVVHLEGPGSESLADLARLANDSFGYAVLTHDGATFPMRVRDIADEANRIRAPFYTRVLLGIPRRSSVVVWSLTGSLHRQFRQQNENLSRRTPWWARTQSWLRDRLEALLAFFLGAPTIALRSVPTQPVDDHLSICRVHDSVLPVIGAPAASRVRVRWGHTEVQGLVQTHVDSSEPSHYIHASGVHLGRGRAAVPIELSVSVPSRLLQQLAAPRDAIVLVRRDVLSLVSRNSLLLVVPIAGLLVGVLQLKIGVVWAIVLALVLVVVSFLPLRLTSIPLRSSGRR